MRTECAGEGAEPEPASGGLTVGVKHVAGEPHLWGAERVIGGEAEDGWKHPAFKTRVLRTPETHTGRTGEIRGLEPTRSWKTRRTRLDVLYFSFDSEQQEDF